MPMLASGVAVEERCLRSMWRTACAATRATECGVGTVRVVGERWTVSFLLQRFQDAPDFTSPVTRQGRRWSAVSVQADPVGGLRVGRLTPAVLSSAAHSVAYGGTE